MSSYSYAFGPNVDYGRSIKASRALPGKSTFARVVDIVVDSDHENYEELGSELSLNGVFFRPLGTPTKQENELLFFAYSSRRNFSQPPLIGEIVEIVNGPSEEATRNGILSTKPYYRTIENIWNSPHQNAYPDVVQDSDQNEGNVELGYDFEDNSSINPLQIFPGDTTIESRLGQSIRLSGVKHRDNIYSNDSNNGEPFIILRNGQGATSQPSQTVVEDINLDPNSIYMVSNHKVPLIQVLDKREAYDTPPEKADLYEGNQILMNAGRIFLNAKEESVLLCGLESVGLAGNTVNLDGIQSISLDASKIHLGVKARKDEEEPVILGAKAQTWLEDLIKVLEGIAADFSVMTPAPPIIAGKLVARGGAMTPVLKKLKAQLPNIQSKKVFTE